MRNHALLTLIMCLAGYPLAGQPFSPLDRPSRARAVQISSGYAGPADPENQSRPLICNSVVRRALDRAWSESNLAAHQPPFVINDKVEYGFSINEDKVSHRVYVSRAQSSYRTDGKPNALAISLDAETIATVHTHNLGVRRDPSLADLRVRVPSFVRSQLLLYVTIPGTGTYNSIDLNAVCSGGESRPLMVSQLPAPRSEP
jgi:hypothetical protein